MNSTVMPSGSRVYTTRPPLLGPALTVIGAPIGSEPASRTACDRLVDVVDVEGDMGKARVAGARLDPAAVGGTAILDQLQPVTGRLQVGDLDIRALHAHHLLNELRVARRAVQQLETERIAKQADRPVEAGDREARVVGRRDREARHCR